jgi:hypothetical protein
VLYPQDFVTNAFLTRRLLNRRLSRAENTFLNSRLVLQPTEEQEVTVWHALCNPLLDTLT